MAVNIRRALNPFRAQLSRRIVFWVFVSVIAIEAIILVPSYMKQEKDLLAQLRRVASAQVDVMMSLIPNNIGDQDLLQRLSSLEGCPNITGGALYHSTGQRIGTFGEIPELSFSGLVDPNTISRRTADGMRYETIWPTEGLQQAYVIVLRQDATEVKNQLQGFTLRITGLILIISLFVTIGAWIALHPLVVFPILRLREDLEKAGEAISEDRRTPDFYAATFKRSDELGEVVSAFRRMYRQISEAVMNRKKAEADLQKSLRQVEDYTETLNKELERGRQMQANFLPNALLQKENWQLAAFMEPAGQVAGDFYDAFDLPDNRIGLVIADVCDKGVGAALFMALFRSLIRIFSGQTVLNGLACPQLPLGDHASKQDLNPLNATEHNPAFSPLKAIELTNDYIAQNHGDLAMFATVFFGVIDLDSGMLTYINGGHEPPLIISRDGGIKQMLDPTGPAVGIVAETPFKIKQTTIEAGESLVGFTDGVTEARDEAGTLFGKNRLLSELKKPAASASELISRISTNLNRHIQNTEPSDDITLLAIRRIG